MFDAVLMVSFGGPQALEDIRPFLQNVLRGRRVPPERIEEVAHHYERFGGVSPLTSLTERQATALRQRLAGRGMHLPVYIGMRNWHPHLADTLRQMREDGVDRAIGLIAAAHRSYSSCTQYKHNVLQARTELAADRFPPLLGAEDDRLEPEPAPALPAPALLPTGADIWEHERTALTSTTSSTTSSPGPLADPLSKPGVPDVIYTDDWHTHAGFIEALVARIEEARSALPPDLRAHARVVFTAHSIPASMAHADTYQRQLHESAHAVAATLRTDDWALVYQSRSGRPQDPWLEPDVNDYLRRARGEGLRAAILSPIGFVCDHIEVLYDLDVEAKATCEEVGLTMARAAAVNDHPRFVDALADAVVSIVDRYRAGRPLPLISAESPNPIELPPPVTA